MLCDNEAERTDGKKGTLWVYSVGISGSLVTAFFFLINANLVKQVPIFTLLAIQALLGYLFLNILLVLVYSEEFMFFSTDAEWGGFGFCHKDQLMISFVYYGLSAGFFGNAGYTICLLFFSPVIVSGCFLFEPFIGQLIGYGIGLDLFPGMRTWVGTSIAVIGVILLQKSDR